MVRAAVQFVVLAFAAVFLALTFAFWCAVGATPGAIVLSKLGLSLGWSIFLAIVSCGVPLALHALRRGQGKPAAPAVEEATPAVPPPEAEAAAPSPPPASERPHYARFVALEAEEAELESRLEDIRRRKQDLERVPDASDALDDAWFT